MSDLKALMVALDALQERSRSASRAELIVAVHVLCAALRRYAAEGEQLRASSRELTDAACELARARERIGDVSRASL